jgi:two-component system phosphate regulon sensor histidine kinase PhoR
MDWLRDRLSDVEQSEALVSLHANNQKRWLQLSLSAVRSVTGEYELAVVVARDVTSLREAEEAKQDFVATVSHELRTPLTSLIGFLLTLRRPDFEPDAEALSDYHGRMLRQARRLERLIEDLLSVSRLERGEFDVAAAPVSIDEIVEKVVQDFAIANPARPVGHVRAGLAGMAMADSGRVEQVVTNLVTNADKYSPSGRSITIEVAREDDGIHVRVSDEGTGIPEDQREAVFERFRRLGHHLTREQGGTGLGLYIARRLVDAMGGRIWVAGREGGG